MQVSSARASGTDKAKSRLSAKMTPESARLPTKAQLPRRDPFVAVKFLRQKRRLDIPDRCGKRQSMSVLEAQFALRVRVAQLPEPPREYRFDAMRRRQFDFAWPNWKIAVECRGGIRGHWALRRTAASTTPRQCRAGGCCALRQAWSKAARRWNC